MKYRLTVKGQVALATLILLIFFAVGSLGLSLKPKPSVGHLSTPMTDAAGPDKPAPSEGLFESEKTLTADRVPEEPSVETLKKTTATILFCPDQWEMQANEIQKINEIIDTLLKYPELKIVIEGNINALPGSVVSDFGKELSLKRAQVAAQVLIGKGVDESRLIVKSNGNSEPVTNDKECAWMNRRAYLYIDGFKGENP